MYLSGETLRKIEQAKQNLASGEKFQCQCRVENRKGDVRSCKRRAVTVNTTGAFIYFCKQHRHVSAD